MRKLKFEYRITIAYLLLGGIWIIFSDRLLALFINDTAMLTRIQTYKGWFYVLITAILFYSLLKNHLMKIRDAEKKAIESDKLKTAFLQNISHEIRTPMNSIIGFSELLMDNNKSEKEVEEYLSMISNSSNQLLNIVNEILDISLIETGNSSVNKRIINLNQLLNSTYNYYKINIKKDISFSLIKGFPDHECNIVTDETKLRQILDNLINNAIKFTEKGYVNFGYYLKDNNIEFYVEDSGIGINADFHNKIFDHFLKLENANKRLYEGVGLGLAICQGNIKLLNGRIWVESEPGKGSKFYFTIPYKPAYDDGEKKKIHLEQPNGKKLSGKTILIAEDDEINLLYIKEIFKDTDAVILQATNGKEAVEICRNNENISLILIDIKMPVMNGYEAIKSIRKFRPDLPIIAQTAFALSDEMLKAFNAGSNDYISKPFKKEQLLSLVLKYLKTDD